MLVHSVAEVSEVWGLHADVTAPLAQLKRLTILDLPPLLRDDLKRERHLAMVFQPLVEANDLVHYSKVVYPILIDRLAEQSTTLLFPRKNFNVTHLGELTTVVRKAVFVTHNHPPRRQNTSHFLHPLRFLPKHPQIPGQDLLLGCQLYTLHFL